MDPYIRFSVGFRRDEEKALAIRNEIVRDLTSNGFQPAISQDFLAKLSSSKYSSSMTSIGIGGSQAQTITLSEQDIRPTSSCDESISHFEASLFYSTQLYKLLIT